MLILPDIYKWYEVLETELNLLLKYYCHIVPRAEQVNIHHYRPVTQSDLTLQYMVTSGHESSRLGWLSRGER